MTNLAFEDWDDGRLRVNRAFAPILQDNGLASFSALMNHSGGTVAKQLLAERTTTRITLSGSKSFYLKRHTPPPLKEYVKPLLRLTWPILGAANEWRALLQFHAAGIPSMTPVALGRSGRHSFVLTEALEGYVKLSHWLEGDPPPEQLSLVGSKVAELAKRMHAAGLHHQDFYAGHLLLKPVDGSVDLRVIDLGRARRFRWLAKRWIIKDLAQLDYSTRQLTARQKVRFLQAYLGGTGRLDAPQKELAGRVIAKSGRIARHSQKNRL